MWLTRQFEQITRRSIAFTLAASPTSAFAASSNLGAGGAPLFLACAIAYLTRRRAIGGWLFIFFFQMLLGIVVIVGLASAKFLPDLPSTQQQSIEKQTHINPLPFERTDKGQQWEDAPSSTHTKPPPFEGTDKNLQFKESLSIVEETPLPRTRLVNITSLLLANIPFYLAFIAVFVLAARNLTHRDTKHLKALRVSYVILLFTSALSVLIEWANSGDELPISIYALILTAIWCAYLFRSHRVQWVLAGNRWNYEEFANRFGIPTPEQLAASKRKGWAAAIVVFLLFLALFGFAGNTPNFAAGAGVGLFWGAIIGALVQHFAARPKREKAEAAVKTAQSVSELAGAKVEQVQGRPDTAKHGLNRKQKAILLATALLALAAFLFPPFVIQLPQSGATYNAGYALLFSKSGAVVNTGLLALELVVVVVVGVIGVFLTKSD